MTRPVKQLRLPRNWILGEGAVDDAAQSSGDDIDPLVPIHKMEWTREMTYEQIVTGKHCEAHDIMVVSGSVGGGNIKERLNACTTPQIIYEVSPESKPNPIATAQH